MPISRDSILTTGAAGMLGTYVDFGTRLTHHELDVSNLTQVLEVCSRRQPKVIFHFAAMTDLAKCEASPDDTYRVNTRGTYNVALAARTVGAKLVYVSSAGVFDAAKVEPYTVSDVPNPINTYGHSKYLGELAVQGILDDYIIARTAWLFGGGPDVDKKFIAKVLRATDTSELRVVTDTHGSPTYAKDMVTALLQLIDKDATGIFHISGESATRYELAQEIAHITGSKAKLAPSSWREFTLGYPTGLNEVLESSVLLRPWQEALREYIETEWKGVS